MQNSLFKMTPGRLILDGFLALCILALFVAGVSVLWMPSSSFHGKLPPPSAKETAIAADLRTIVTKLAGEIGERNQVKYAQLQQSIEYIESFLRAHGYEVKEQEYKIAKWSFKNIEVEIRGASKPEEIILIGGHYDSVLSAPGANDNGSGVATVLELAKLLAHAKPDRTLRFVLFTNEEPPYFSSEDMGSYHYAMRCKQRGENIVAMLDPETLGYYTDKPGSQKYPSAFMPLYPTTGDFIFFVGNMQSRPLVEECVRTFRETTPFPSEGVSAPEFFSGVDLADQYWFWKNGYKGLMITDTAPYRYPHYHTAEDTPDKLNYDSFSRVVGGLERVVERLANRRESL